MTEEYIKPSEIAKRFGVTRGAVYKWIREGRLPSVRFGENAVRVPRSAVEEFERQAREDAEKNEAPGLVTRHEEFVLAGV